MKERLLTLLTEETLLVWDRITAGIDSLYDVDRAWNKGFRSLKTAGVCAGSGSLIYRAAYPKTGRSSGLVVGGRHE